MTRLARLTVAAALSIALSRSARAERTACASAHDPARVVDLQSLRAFLRMANRVCGAGGPTLHLVAVGSLRGAPIATAAERLMASARRSGREGDLVLLVAKAERKAALVGGTGQWRPSARHVEEILARTIRPRLAEGRPGRGAVEAAAEILVAFGADPDDVADPYGERAIAARMLVQVGGFFAFLVGAIISVLVHDRRVKRQRALAAAGLAPPPDPEPPFGAPPPAVPLDALPFPPRHHQWRLSFAVGWIVTVLGLVMVAAARSPGWQIAMAAFGTIAWVAGAGWAVARAPPVRLGADRQAAGALVVRGRVVGASIGAAASLALLLLFDVLVVPHEMRVYLAAFGAALPLFVAYDLGRCRVEFAVSDEALERRSPWLRRAKRVAWRDVDRVDVERPDPRLCIGTPRSYASWQLVVPLSLDGVGDLAAVLLRNVPAGAFHREPAARELLERLADGARRERESGGTGPSPRHAPPADDLATGAGARAAERPRAERERA